MLQLKKTLGYLLLRRNKIARDPGDLELCLDYNFWRIELWKIEECPRCVGLLLEYCTEVPMTSYAFDFRHGFYTMKGMVLRRNK